MTLRFKILVVLSLIALVCYGQDQSATIDDLQKLTSILALVIGAVVAFMQVRTQNEIQKSKAEQQHALSNVRDELLKEMRALENKMVTQRDIEHMRQLMDAGFKSMDSQTKIYIAEALKAK